MTDATALGTFPITRPNVDHTALVVVVAALVGFGALSFLVSLLSERPPLANAEAHASAEPPPYSAASTHADPSLPNASEVFALRALKTAETDDEAAAPTF